MTSAIETIITTCPKDCYDACGIAVLKQDGVITRVRGDQNSGTEALNLEVSHFVRCIEQGESPLTGGDAGLVVVQILEAASQSMALRGQPVPLRS